MVQAHWRDTSQDTLTIGDLKESSSLRTFTARGLKELDWRLHLENSMAFWVWVVLPSWYFWGAGGGIIIPSFKRLLNG